MELKFEHRTLRTPVDTVNILTAGGIKMGSITEIFGPNAAGKSSIAYQIAKYFQEDYPDGKVYVIDTENSADYIRLKSSFKLDLDVSRFEVEYPPNLEAGFKLLNRACLEDYKLEDGTERPILVIWDTIAVGRPERETAVGISFEEKDLYNMGINSGGMNLRPRIIEHSLAILMPLLIEKPVSIIILNQVRTSGFNNPGGPSTKSSSGGNAMKHAMHYKFFLRKKKELTAGFFGESNADRKLDKAGTPKRTAKS